MNIQHSKSVEDLTLSCSNIQDPENTLSLDKNARDTNNPRFLTVFLYPVCRLANESNPPRQFKYHDYS